MLTDEQRREFEQRAQQAAEARLIACEESLFDDGELEGKPYPGCAPFCGCHTCVVREVLDAAYEPLMELARAEVADEQNDR